MAYRKLGRNSSSRKALLRSMMVSFFKYGRIETTVAKAKEASIMANKIITLAKYNDLHARRQIIASIINEDITKKIFKNIAPKYAERKGGYTRILKLGQRRGDAAPMAILELV